MPVSEGRIFESSLHVLLYTTTWKLQENSGSGH
jgi:hypothetical protein